MKKNNLLWYNQTIGGFAMKREYKKIQQHKEKLLEMKKQGLTHREMAEILGYSKNQIKEFFCLYNEKQRKLSMGVAIKKKGRPPKDYVVTEDMKIQELKYIIARKDSKIKSLEMQNELMRDFLSLTERK